MAARDATRSALANTAGLPIGAPDNPEFVAQLHFVVGAMENDLGNYHSAVRSLETALRLNPSSKRDGNAACRQTDGGRQRPSRSDAPETDYAGVGFAGLGLLTNHPFNLAYEAAVAFTDALKSQYYDTARFVGAELAKSFPREVVGVYAGAGKSGLFRGGDFASVEREDIKGAVKKREVRILVATDAACEGLSLQTLGTLINVDLPWNPARLEQRLGRIKRFGQARRTVDMLNLVYHDTQDETVYQVLSRRMKDRYDIFGGLPDTIEDDWIAGKATGPSGAPVDSSASADSPVAWAVGVGAIGAADSEVAAGVVGASVTGSDAVATAGKVWNRDCWPRYVGLLIFGHEGIAAQSRPRRSASYDSITAARATIAEATWIASLTCRLWRHCNSRVRCPIVGLKSTNLRNGDLKNATIFAFSASVISSSPLRRGRTTSAREMAEVTMMTSPLCAARRMRSQSAARPSSPLSQARKHPESQ